MVGLGTPSTCVRYIIAKGKTGSRNVAQERQLASAAWKTEYRALSVQRVRAEEHRVLCRYAARQDFSQAHRCPTSQDDADGGISGSGVTTSRAPHFAAELQSAGANDAAQRGTAISIETLMAGC
jgi:hypothetical protein